MAKFRLNLIPAFAIALASVGTAFAGPDDATWDPPARYSGIYKGRININYATPAEVGEKCRELLDRYNITNPETGVPAMGCTVPNADSCDVLVIDRQVGRTTPEDVIIHEIGHCAGWPANHPQ